MNVRIEIKKNEDDSRWIDGIIYFNDSRFTSFSALNFAEEIRKVIIRELAHLYNLPSYSEWKGFDHESVQNTLHPYLFHDGYVSHKEIRWNWA